MSNQTINRRAQARRQRRRGFRSGNAIIETAIAFNVLLWLSMGMVEFGEFFYIRHAFEAAARDGARTAVMATAVQSGTAGSVDAVIMNDLRQAIPTIATSQYTMPSWLTLTMSYTDPASGAVTSNITDCSTVPYGEELTISISTTEGQLPQGATIRPLHAITGKGIPDSKTIGGQATFVKE